MHALTNRKLSDGSSLALSVEYEEIVARKDGLLIEPAGAYPGCLWGIDLMGPHRRNLVAQSGGSHILQGNVLLVPVEAAAVIDAKASILDRIRPALERGVPGVTHWQAARDRYSAALSEYNFAHNAEGADGQLEAALRLAAEGIEAVFNSFPATRAWARIMTYRYSGQPDRVQAARQAQAAILEGANPFDAAHAMMQPVAVAANTDAVMAA